MALVPGCLRGVAIIRTLRWDGGKRELRIRNGTGRDLERTMDVTWNLNIYRRCLSGRSGSKCTVYEAWGVHEATAVDFGGGGARPPPASPASPPPKRPPHHTPMMKHIFLRKPSVGLIGLHVSLLLLCVHSMSPSRFVSPPLSISMIPSPIVLSNLAVSLRLIDVCHCGIYLLRHLYT